MMSISSFNFISNFFFILNFEESSPLIAFTFNPPTNTSPEAVFLGSVLMFLDFANCSLIASVLPCS